MTAPTPDQLLALCEQLDVLRAAATVGDWRKVLDDYHCPHVVTGANYVCETHDNPADAALIVTAINALPALTAAVRGLLADRDTLARVAALAEELDALSDENYTAYKRGGADDARRGSPYTEGYCVGIDVAVSGLRRALGVGGWAS